MAISSSEVQSLMNAEKDRLLPKFTEIIDGYCRNNLATEYKFVLSVDADNNHDGDDVTLDVVDSREILRLPSEYVWESGMMSLFIGALSKLYRDAGWSVEVDGSFSLEVEFKLSFAVKDSTA